MKKTNKVNPLTHFNNTKTAAYKKASKEMANYKKSLPKAQKGFIGPKTEWESILSNQPPIPRPNRPSMSSIKKHNPWAASIELKVPRPNMNVGIANAARQIAAGQKVLNDAAIFDKNNAANANYNNSKNTKGVVAGKVMEFTPAQLRAMGVEKRNGGPVKRKKK